MRKCYFNNTRGLLISNPPQEYCDREGCDNRWIHGTEPPICKNQPDDRVAPPPEPSYPECEKWAKVHSDASAILNFLDWKDAREAKEMHISYQDLVYEYFEFDPKKLEEERRLMIERL